LMRMELDPQRAAKLRSILHFNGLPIDARSVTDNVLAQEGLALARAASEPSTTPHAAGVGGE
jgi:hypothetical protein